MKASTTALGQLQLARYPAPAYAILRRLAAMSPAELERLARASKRHGYHAYADGKAPPDRPGGRRKPYRALSKLDEAARAKQRIWAATGDRRILAPPPATGMDVHLDIVHRVRKAIGKGDRPFGIDADSLPYTDWHRMAFLAPQAAITAIIAADRLEPADRDWLLAAWEEVVGM